jgi:Divergent InlB B-repeat domain
MRRGPVLFGTAAAAVLAAAVFAGAAKNQSDHVMLRLEFPPNRGTVETKDGKYRCTSSCEWRFRKGAVVSVRAMPSGGWRFGRWSGPCSGRGRCVVSMTRSRTLTVRFAALPSSASWNLHTPCRATLTTLPAILGSQQGGTRGAIEAGGAFQPHLAGAAQRHLLNPPCSIGGETTFVELHGLVAPIAFKPSDDGDWTGNLTDPNRAGIKDPNLKTIHAEIDGTWRSAGVAPAVPPAGVPIDVQGFVYWDPGHIADAWHSFSGWELHPLAAWRPARG